MLEQLYMRFETLQADLALSMVLEFGHVRLEEEVVSVEVRIPEPAP